jgi:hypothetical protein
MAGDTKNGRDKVNDYDYEVEEAYNPSDEDLQDYHQSQEGVCVSCGEEIEGTNQEGQCNECWCDDEVINKVPKGVLYANF